MGFFSDSLPGQRAGTLNLRTLYDPADVMGGQAASDDLRDAGQAQAAGTQAAIDQQMDMYRQQAEMGAPYRQIGYDVLPQMRAGLAPDSAIGNFRSNAARQFMAQRLGNLGFNERASASLGQRGVASAQAGEAQARQGRIRDMVTLGSGQTAQGMGMAGRQGAGQAQMYLQGAQQQGQIMADRSTARQAQMAGLTYGAGQFFNNRVGQQAADTARGSYYGR